MADLVEQLLALFGREPAVIVKEATQGGAVGPLHRLQGGPGAQKLAGRQAAQVPQPVQGLWEVGFQQVGEAIGQARPVSHRLTPVFDQQAQLPRHGVVGLPGAQTVAVRAHQLQQQVGVAAIAFGSAAGEGFPVAGQRLGRDGIEQKEIIIHQRVDHCPAESLQCRQSSQIPGPGRSCPAGNEPAVRRPRPGRLPAFALR